MNGFTEQILTEQRRLQRLIDLTGPFENTSPEGVLLLQKRGDNTYCYLRQRGKGRKPHKSYLGKPDSEAARDFVRERFVAEKRSRLLQNQGLLSELMAKYQDYSYGAVMDSLPQSFRGIALEDFNDKRYEELKRWANADFPRNTAPFPDSEIYAQNGERVRSKGECLYANTLLDAGIPFRYDSILTIADDYGNTKNVSPDFHIRCFDYSHVIIEHLGRLFDKGYAINFGEKCYWYLQAGFILGRNFFVTSDDLHGGTDSRAIHRVVAEVQRQFFGY